MQTTIDQAGRVVIPLALRQKAGLKPGTRISVALDDQGDVRLARIVSRPKLVRVGKLLVARPTARVLPGIDITQILEQERDRWPR